ncbi:haloacid dehalogenase-like hydrolase [Vibrio aphrogenes]|uniref:haloacid dehalogenase-like hydrolase n=1 Tax=Vibrio aphrogenes TaxID=1891186 RepID=UPI000B35964B|nr:HAD family hydrolase [Vibrio aphrogenes]
MKRKYLLIDICGTLYKENTTFSFLDYFYKNRLTNVRKLIFIKVINKISMVLFGFDLIKYFSLKSLKGVPKDELYKKAKVFVRENLNKNIAIFDFIESKLSHGYELKLVSATIDPIAEAISIELGIPYISSQLEYKNDICSGKLMKDILLSKREIVMNEINDYDVLEIITDNKTDISLCHLCTNFYSVSYSRESTIFWYKNGAKNVYEF